MKTIEKSFFIAFDLGTTTLSGWLIDKSGEVAAKVQLRNSQSGHGVDILSRLERAQQGEGKILQALLVKDLKGLVASLLEETGLSHANLVSAAAAGNPGMSCLLCNEPVASLLTPPHRLPFKGLRTILPGEVDLGLSCSVELFPSVSGFVGGDLVACLFSLDDVKQGTLLIDLGTNAEIALWDGNRWWVTSAAAGPAFEGGNINSGMLHARGAVTAVCLHDDRLQLVVQGSGVPAGICGSGLTSLVARALEGGLIDPSGTIRSADLVETNLNRYIVEKDGFPMIRYYHSATQELCLTQQDVRNFQLAKGAVRAAVQVLLEKSDFLPKDIAAVYLTGALGENVAKEDLKRVALLPEPMVDKTSFVESGVLSGLKAFLIAKNGKQELAHLVDNVQPFPLSGTPAFEKHYMKSLDFVEMLKC